MNRSDTLWFSFYLALMIGHFLLLTVVLPSTFGYEPDWIRVGSFAEYSVEDGTLNGTYTWRVVAIENQIATIYETFQGTTHWDHVAGWNNTEQTFDSIMPVSGKTTKISVTMGTIGDLILWLKRYYNSILLDRTFFLGIPEHVWRGVGEGEMSFQGQTRHMLCLEASEEWQWSRTADYDEATGILIRYSWSWPRLGAVWASLKSTNVFASITSEPRIFLDLLLIAPLFILPLVGAVVGLSSIRHRGGGFSTRFWLVFILLNGVLIAILSNFPIKIPIGLINFLQSGMLIIGLVVLGFFLINVAFWTGILGASILTLNRFVLPIIAKKTE